MDPTGRAGRARNLRTLLLIMAILLLLLCALLLAQLARQTSSSWISNFGLVGIALSLCFGGQLWAAPQKSARALARKQERLRSEVACSREALCSNPKSRGRFNPLPLSETERR